jgi:hypothetical protein
MMFKPNPKYKADSELGKDDLKARRMYRSSLKIRCELAEALKCALDSPILQSREAVMERAAERWAYSEKLYRQARELDPELHDKQTISSMEISL